MSNDFGFGFGDGLRDLDDELEELQQQAAGGGSFYVGTAVEYAVYLEFGTSKMDPKPFFRPALAEARRDVEAFIADNTNRELSEFETAREVVRSLALALERRVKEIITEKGLIDTGTLRASIRATRNPGQLPSAEDIDASADVEVTP